MRNLAFIFLCCFCFLLWQTTGLISPVKVLSLYKIGAALIVFYFTSRKEVKYFCISYAILMLYPWAPAVLKQPAYYLDSVRYLTWIDAVEWLFFGVWFLYACGLVIYLYFSRHD